MRHIISIFKIFFFLLLVENVMAQTSPKNSLTNIQSQIQTRFMEAQRQSDATPLLQLNAELQEQYGSRKQNIFVYWRAYAKYYTAIFYLTQSDKENAEKNIDKAVEWLDNLKNKTSEDYALLSLTEGFAIQFKNMVKIIFLSGQIEKHGKLAIEKDPRNLRAYFVLGSSDFYKPERFGGGKNVEEYLLKAIALPDQSVKNDVLPSWGKREAYELLIRWYIRKGNHEKAKIYHAEAMKNYPNDSQLQGLAKQIKSWKL